MDGAPSPRSERERGVFLTIQVERRRVVLEALVRALITLIYSKSIFRSYIIVYSRNAATEHLPHLYIFAGVTITP